MSSCRVRGDGTSSEGKTMNDQPMCNCEAWSCTCDGNWPASSGRFCHLHGTPHPKGLLRLWQQFLYHRSTRRAPVRSQQENT